MRNIRFDSIVQIVLRSISPAEENVSGSTFCRFLRTPSVLYVKVELLIDVTTDQGGPPNVSQLAGIGSSDEKAHDSALGPTFFGKSLAHAFNENH